MAIAQTTISKSAGWARTDVINQLEQAFTWLGFNGSTQTGWISGIGSYFGGGTVGSSSNDYYDVFPVSTTGIGTGASFYVDRNGGSVYRVFVNRPGYGYTGGEIVTLSAEDIGGSANGATNIQIKVAVAGTVTDAVSYAVTFASGSAYNASGTDRNGVVSGTNTTITIREGDTLSITNNSSYVGGISWLNASTFNTENGVHNVHNQYAPTGGGVYTWTPLPGQRGTYYIKDQSYSGITTTTIVVTAADPSNINYTGVGSTTSFYDKDVTSGGTYPWGVMRHEIQSNKKFGSTYRAFQVVSDNSIKFHVGSSFHPTNETSFLYGSSNYAYNIFNGSALYPNRFAGNRYFDTPYNIDSGKYFRRTNDDFSSLYQAQLTFSNSTSYQLDLNIFRSGLDPKFAVLSFRHPTLSSLRLRDNTFASFILHNFTTPIWDLDNLFLGGLTTITPSSGDNDPYLYFTSYIAGNVDNNYTNSPSKRCAEFGYIQYGLDNYNYSLVPYKTTVYRPNSYPYSSGDSSVGIYVRNNAPTSTRGSGGFNNAEYLPSSTNYNAVIKGIPLNVQLAPCPYYLPDDFVLIDFDYATPSANIQQGDTVTISESEVYTVITGSYNQTTRTRGILFCARTV